MQETRDLACDSHQSASLSPALAVAEVNISYACHVRQSHSEGAGWSAKSTGRVR